MKVHKQTVLRNAAILGSAAVMVAGGAYDADAAVNALVVKAYPTQNGAPIMGAGTTKIAVRVSNGDSQSTDSATLYFISSTGQVLSSAAMTRDGTGGGTASAIHTYGSAPPTGATSVAVVFDRGAGDDTCGGQTYCYVTNANAMVGKTSKDGALQDAISTGNGLIPIKSSYTGLSVVRAAENVVKNTAGGVAVIEFTADPYKTVVIGAAAPVNNVSGNANATEDIAFKSTTGTALVTPGTVTVTGGRIFALLGGKSPNVDANDDKACYYNVAVGDGTALTTSIAANDGTTAGPPVQCIDIPGLYTALKPDLITAPSGGKLAIAEPVAAAAYVNATAYKVDQVFKNAATGYYWKTKTAGTTVAGAAPAGTTVGAEVTDGAVFVNMGISDPRLDQLYDAKGTLDGMDVYVRSTMPAAAATGVAPQVKAGTKAITATVGAPVATDPTLIKYTITAPDAATGGFRFVAGKLQYGSDRATASTFADIDDVTVKATDLKYAYDSAAVSVNADFTKITEVAAGVAQKPLVSTWDSTGDGWIDGVTVDFRQTVSDPGTSMVLLSNPKAGALWTDPISSIRVALTPTKGNGATTTQYTIKLATADVPVVDNNGVPTAPTTANNDWDASGGAADAADAALVTQGRFNTSVVNDTVTGSTHDGRPFHVALTTGAAYTGVYDKATNVALLRGYYDFLDGATRVFGSAGFNSAASTPDANAALSLVRSYDDGAAPVVIRASYTQVNAAQTTPTKRDANGTLTVYVSEDVELSMGSGDQVHGQDAKNTTAGQSTKPLPDEFLLDGMPISLFNLGNSTYMPDAVDANTSNAGAITDQTGSINKDAITFSLIPATAVGKILSVTSFTDTYQANLNTVGAATVDAADVVGNTYLGAAVATHNYKASDYLLKVSDAAKTVVSAGGGFKLSEVLIPSATQITAKFNQAIVAPGSQTAADLDGVFIVRALVGERRGPVFQNRERNYVFQDFRIPGSHVTYSTSDNTAVNITMPAVNGTNLSRALPTDTVAVYVDYQPGPSTGKSYVNIAGTTPTPATATGDLGKPFDTGVLYNKSAQSTNVATIAIDAAVPENFGDDPSLTPNAVVDVIGFNATLGAVYKTATANAGGTSITYNQSTNPIVAVDNNTAVKVLPAYLANQLSSNSSDLYTMTVKGDLKTGLTTPTAVPEGTGVSVTLVRVRPGDLDGCATGKRASVVNNAWVQVRRGPNSHGDHLENDNNVNIAAYQTVALANKAVTGADLDRYIAAVDKAEKASKALAKAQQENRPGLDINKLSVDYDAAAAEKNAASQIYAYVQVTTGTGTDVKDGASTQFKNDSGTSEVDNPNHGNNPNATYGRTAVLVKSADLTNRRNGETVYPVTITLPGAVPNSSSPVGLKIDARVDVNNSGTIDAGDEAANHTSGLINGGLNVTWGSLGLAEKRKPLTLEVVDRATAYTDASGRYSAIVAVAELPISAAVGPTGGSIAPEISNNIKDNDLFVLVAVRNPADGKYIQVNSADPAMASFRPFKADISITDPTKVGAAVVNANLDLVKTMTVYPTGWNLLPFNGKLDAATTNTAGDYDLGRMMISVEPDMGKVTTGWAYDHGNAEMAFTMGNATKGNDIAMAFQVGKAITGMTGAVLPAGTIDANGQSVDFSGDPSAIGKSRLPIRDGAAVAVNNNGGSGPLSFDQETDTVYRFKSCAGGGSGQAAPLTLVTTSKATNFTFQVPLKSGTPAPVMKQGWNLLSLAAATDTTALSAASKGVTGLVWFDRDTNSTPRARSWFSGDAVVSLPAGTAAFMFQSLTTSPTL